MNKQSQHYEHSGRKVIAHGTVVADYGVFQAHIVIENGRVVGLSADENALRDADEIIDATGLHIFPGAIDMHAHFEDPGHTEREDFTTGTMAAAAGGITTVLEHPLTYPPTTTVELYREKRAMAESKSIVDFALWGALTRPSLSHMQGQFAEGAMGFKAFMPLSEPDYPPVTDAELLEGMSVAASLGALVLVHAENEDLMSANRKRLQKQGRNDPQALHEWRPPIVEEEAVHRALFFAARAGARIQIVHVSSPVSVDLVSEARAAGVQATVEVCPHHLLLDLDDLDALGPYGYSAPALRDRELVELLWDQVLDGSIDSLVSDHAAYTPEQKDVGWEDLFATPLGCQVIQETVPLVLSEAVWKRGMSLDAFARFSATNAARTAGLYPKKGTIVPGSDADLAIYDLESEWSVNAKNQQFSKNPTSPFEGRSVKGRLICTLVRGVSVFANGEIMVEPGFGKFLRSQTEQDRRTLECLQDGGTR